MFVIRQTARTEYPAKTSVMNRMSASFRNGHWALTRSIIPPIYVFTDLSISSTLFLSFVFLSSCSMFLRISPRVFSEFPSSKYWSQSRLKVIHFSLNRFSMVVSDSSCFLCSSSIVFCRPPIASLCLLSITWRR